MTGLGWRWRGSLGWLVWWSAACGPSAKQARSADPTGAPADVVCDARIVSFRTDASARPDLAFTPRGSRLLVDGRWLLDPSAGDFQPIVACPAQRGGVCLSGELALAPDERQFALVSGEGFALGTLGAALGELQPFPRWLPEVADAASSALAHAAVWLTEDTLLFVQSYADAHGDAACRVFDTKIQRWQPTAAECPRPELSHLGALEAGPSQLLAVHSSAEGSSALQIQRYPARSGEADVLPAALVVQGPSRWRVAFASDGARVDVLTPCELGGADTAACENGFDDEALIKHYALTLGDTRVRLVRAGLPAGAIKDPLRERYAWVAEGAVCVGDPGSERVTCWRLPAGATACR